MHPTSHDLPEAMRQQLCLILNDRLADVIDLSLQAKQAHWNVKGPGFMALHEFFDELAALFPAQADEIAERIVALGGTAEGTLATVGDRSHLPAYPLDITAGVDHLTALATAVARFGKAVRQDIDRTDELGDADTADLFTGISRDLDKHLWFIEAHLHGNQ